jgi:hypothetical protein
MLKRRILIIGFIPLIAVSFLWGVDRASAKSQGQQSQLSHDQDWVIQRQAKRVTQEQRVATASALRAALEKADPDQIARRQAARDAASQTAQARVAVLQAANNSDAQTLKTDLRLAELREAKARAAAARAAAGRGAATLNIGGGTNE